MEEVIIEFKEHDYNHTLKQRQKEVEAIQSFINDVRVIAPINFNNNLLRDLIDSSDSYAVIAAIKEAIRNQLQAAGITIPAILEASTKDSYEKFLETKRGRVINKSLIDAIDIDNNIVSLKPGFEDELKKQFIHSIKTPAGLEVQQAHINLVEALNKLSNLIDSHWGFSISHYASCDVNGRNWKINTGVAYDVAAKENNWKPA